MKAVNVDDADLLSCSVVKELLHPNYPRGSVCVYTVYANMMGLYAL